MLEKESFKKYQNLIRESTDATIEFKINYQLKTKNGIL